MAAGYSRVQIFNPLGSPISEIDVPTVRSWVLNQTAPAVGRLQFTFPVFDPLTGAINPKCTLANFQYGNFIVATHKPSVNADGTTNGVLPPWVGVILPPQSWEYGKVTITAYSAEQILAYRPLYNEHISVGGPGSTFSLIISRAQLEWGGIPIQPGNIDLSGVGASRDITTTAFDEIQKLAQQFNCDWDITPQITSGNRLVLQANWYLKKGVNSGVVLSNANLMSASPMYTEQGTVYNAVYGVNDAPTINTRVNATSRNETLISQQGILAIKQVFSGQAQSAQPVIQSMSDAFLAQLPLNFVKTFAPTLLDAGNNFSFAVCGNTFIVQNDYVGFSNGGVGINGTIRITAVEYNELTNQAKMAGVLQ